MNDSKRLKWSNENANYNANGNISKYTAFIYTSVNYKGKLFNSIINQLDKFDHQLATDIQIIKNLYFQHEIWQLEN